MITCQGVGTLPVLKPIIFFLSDGKNTRPSAKRRKHVREKKGIETLNFHNNDKKEGVTQRKKGPVSYFSRAAGEKRLPRK